MILNWITIRTSLFGMHSMFLFDLPSHWEWLFLAHLFSSFKWNVVHLKNKQKGQMMWTLVGKVFQESYHINSTCYPLWYIFQTEMTLDSFNICCSFSPLFLASKDHFRIWYNVHYFSIHAWFKLLWGFPWSLSLDEIVTKRMDCYVHIVHLINVSKILSVTSHEDDWKMLMILMFC